MFDNSKPNVILIADDTNVLFMTKTLGVLKVANSLRSAGYEVLVISHVHIFTIDELFIILKHAISKHTLFVGFSTVFYKTSGNPVVIKGGALHEEGGVQFQEKQIGAMLPHGVKYNASLRHYIKSLNPNCKLVLGGPDALDEPYVKDYDYVVIGYAETSAVNLADHLSSKEQLCSNYKSVLNRAIIVDDRFAPGYNFAETPVYLHECDLILPGESISIEIGRGCIFQCAFCSYPMNGKKKNDFVKHEEILRTEFMYNYENFGITRYTIIDDTFNDSREKIEMIHRMSKSLPFELEYWAFIRLDLVAAHPETMGLLVESGLRAAFFGIESLHPNAAKAVGKGGRREKLISTINTFKERYGNKVMLHGSFIVGLPEEPVDSMKETIQQLLNCDIKLDTWMVEPFYMNICKGTYESPIDKNPGKFGYRTDNQAIGPNEGIYWENDYTNFYECRDLSMTTLENHRASGQRRLTGRDSFNVSSYGFDLQYSANQLISQFDWHGLDLTKQKRVVEYKKQLCKVIGLDFKSLAH
jgi:hypothetical protein